MTSFNDGRRTPGGGYYPPEDLYYQEEEESFGEIPPRLATNTGWLEAVSEEGSHTSTVNDGGATALSPAFSTESTTGVDEHHTERLSHKDDPSPLPSPLADENKGVIGVGPERREQPRARQSDSGISALRMNSHNEIIDYDFEDRGTRSVAIPRDIVQEKRDEHKFQSIEDIMLSYSGESNGSFAADAAQNGSSKNERNEAYEGSESNHVSDLKSVLADDYKMEAAIEPAPVFEFQRSGEYASVKDQRKLNKERDAKSTPQSDAEIKRRARGGRRAQARVNAVRLSPEPPRAQGPSFEAADESSSHAEDQPRTNYASGDAAATFATTRPGAVSVDEPAPVLTDAKGRKNRHGNRLAARQSHRMQNESDDQQQNQQQNHHDHHDQVPPPISVPAPSASALAPAPAVLSPGGETAYDYHREANINDGLSAFSIPASMPPALDENNDNEADVEHAGADPHPSRTLTADVMIASVSPSSVPVSRVDITSPSSAIHSEITSNFDGSQFGGAVSGAIPAELVPSSAQASEEERERIRRQAEEEAEARLFGAVATEAEVVVVIDPIKEAIERQRRRRMFAIAGCCLVLAVVVIVVSIVLTRPSGSSSSARLNDLCQDAIGPLNPIMDNVTGIINTTATADDLTCQTSELDTDGLGLWYFLEGEGNRVRASTRFDETEFDTQILIFSGDCDNVACIAGNDQSGEDDTSVVTWLAESGVTYRILVRGFRASSVGDFTLGIESVDDNSMCDDAVDIDVDVDIFEDLGSTRNVTFDDALIDCPSSSSSSSSVSSPSPTAWYRIVGDGKSRRATVIVEETSFGVARLSLLEGDSCGDLSCIGDQSDFTRPTDDPADLTAFTWTAEVGTTYYVVVHGEDEQSAGDFFLNVDVLVPENDSCVGALEISPTGILVAGSTLNARTDDINVCGQTSTSPGVWYTVDGTGAAMTASTCETTSGFVVNLDVFSSSDSTCGELGCVDTTITACGTQTSVSWLTSKGLKYYVFAQAFVVGSGDFNLTLSNSVPLSANTCNSSIAFGNIGGSPVLGTTAGASVDTGLCANISSPSVWYTMEGTGEDLVASTCNPGTNFASNIAVFTGGCSRLNCVDMSAGPCANQNRAVSWSSKEGQIYHLLVHGQEDVDSGTFQLSVREDSLNLPNDICDTAEPLAYPSAILTSVSGTTINARPDNVQGCGRETRTSTGVWYFVVGEGSSMTASLCSDITDFDTQIHIYSGDCDALKCVASDDDSCPSGRSIVQWKAEAGVSYFIFVTGFGDVGNFELTLQDDSQ